MKGRGDEGLQDECYAEAFVALDFDHDDLAEDGAKFAAGGGDAVKGAAVAGWEGFGWDLGWFLLAG